MVTIENLEVRFDVEGEGDEAVFARLFARYIERWHESQKESGERRKRLDADRDLGQSRQPGGAN